MKPITRHDVKDRMNQYIGSFVGTGVVGIELSKLTEEHKDRLVLYHDHHSGIERGVISSWNHLYIFVRFTMGSTAAACDPSQLEFEHDVDET